MTKFILAAFLVLIAVFPIFAGTPPPGTITANQGAAGSPWPILISNPSPIAVTGTFAASSPPANQNVTVINPSPIPVTGAFPTPYAGPFPTPTAPAIQVVAVPSPVSVVGAFPTPYSGPFPTPTAPAIQVVAVPSPVSVVGAFPTPYSGPFPTPTAPAIQVVAVPSPVTIANALPTPYATQNVNLTQVNGSSVSLGLTTMSNSLPVSFPSDGPFGSASQTQIFTSNSQTMTIPTTGWGQVSVFLKQVGSVQNEGIGIRVSYDGSTYAEDLSTCFFDMSLIDGNCYEQNQAMQTLGLQTELLRSNVGAIKGIQLISSLSGGSWTSNITAIVTVTNGIPVDGIAGYIFTKSTQSTSPWVDNIADFGGTAVTLGQKTMTSSMPVTIASNQAAFPVTVPSPVAVTGAFPTPPAIQVVAVPSPVAVTGAFPTPPASQAVTGAFPTPPASQAVTGSFPTPPPVQIVAVPSPVAVTIAGDQAVNVAQVGGSSFALGAAANSSSLPVTNSNALQVVTAAYTSSTGTLNLDMLTNATSGWYDAAAFNQFSADIYTTTTVTGGIITFEQTNDTTNDSAGIVLNLQDESVLTQTNVTTLTLAATTVKHYRAPLLARYVRFRLSTAFTGTGAVGATVTFKQGPYAPLTYPVNQTTAASLATTATIASGTVTTVSTVTTDNIAAGTTNGCMSPGSTLLTINGTTSGTSATQIIALSAGKKIFVCTMSLFGSGGTTPTFQLVYGTGSNCATGQTALTPAIPFSAASTSYQFPSPTTVTASANELCYLQTGTLPTVDYVITYTQQ